MLFDYYVSKVNDNSFVITETGGDLDRTLEFPFDDIFAINVPILGLSINQEEKTYDLKTVENYNPHYPFQLRGIYHFDRIIDNKTFKMEQCDGICVGSNKDKNKHVFVLTYGTILEITGYEICNIGLFLRDQEDRKKFYATEKKLDIAARLYWDVAGLNYEIDKLQKERERANGKFHDMMDKLSDSYLEDAKKKNKI